MIVRITRRRYSAVRIAGIAVIGLGVAVLVGWALDLNVLIRVWPGVPATKANAAVMFVIAGAGLAVLARAEPRRPERLFAAIAGGFCAALSALTLLEYLWRGLGSTNC